MDFTPDPPVDSGDAAYRDGYAAYEDGAPRSANPHPLDSEESEEWDTGWTDAESEL